MNDAMFVRADLLREQRDTRGSGIPRCDIAFRDFDFIDEVRRKSGKPKCMTGKRGERYLNILNRSVQRREQHGNPRLSIFRAADPSKPGSLQQFNAESACLAAIINFE